MNKITIFFANLVAIVAALAVIIGGMGAVSAYAQTSAVTGSNGTTYSYNTSTGTYIASNGTTYNPSTGTYMFDGTTYTYNPNNGYYSSNGVNYVYNSSTNTYNLVTPPAGTPVFYTEGGVPVYNTGAAIPAGSYENASGQALYYYGNGIYYDPLSQTYGDINSPGFVSTTYPDSVSTAQAGAPDTGAGGEAALNWTLLALAALTTLSGATYLVYKGTTPLPN